MNDEVKEVKEEGLVETLATEGGADAEQGGVEEPVVEEKMVPQSKVNELVGRARQEGRESAMRELLDKYGVGDDAELDDIFGRGQKYDILNDEYESEKANYRATAQENALLKSGADEDRWEDIKLILGGHGLDVTVENIAEFAETHPEWLKAKARVAEPVTVEEAKKAADRLEDKEKSEKVSVIKKFGSSASTPKKDTIDEEEYAMSMFGM